MASKVFFLPGKEEQALLSGLPGLLDTLLPANFENNKLVGIKVHFGERGNVTFVSADYSRVAVDCLKKRGARPFLFETNTLYYGQRGNTIDHLNLATEHDFTPNNVGAPVVIIDGIRGENWIDVPVKGRLLKKARLGAMITEIPVVLGFSHFKGHMLSGFGATIKNFSMGTAARGGKLEMHSLTKPWIDIEKCTGCGDCMRQCAAEAIVEKGDDFIILEDKCTGCAGCIGVCQAKAVRINWNEASDSASRKMAEYALASVQGKEGYYVNFVINITKHCDCWGEAMTPICDDVGILASRDPVAVDQACFDMVEAPVRSAHPEVDPEIQLSHAAEIGLGSRQYVLEEI